MPSIKVKTPAKINLTLEIVGKSENGFHEIKSIMSAINLYDYLTFEIEPSKNNKNEIFLSGNNPQIPYRKLPRVSLYDRSRSDRLSHQIYQSDIR